MKLSSLAGVFKVQGQNQMGLLAHMDLHAGIALGRAKVRGQMLGSISRIQGGRSAAGLMWGGMKSPMMKGAMYGAGLGAAGAVGSDAMNNNLGFGTFGRAIGGAMRGSTMGALGGAGFGAGRMFMGRNTMMRSAFRTARGVSTLRGSIL